MSILCRNVVPTKSPQLTDSLERETGIEPATNSLEGCDSTTELLPPVFRINHLQHLQSRWLHLPLSGSTFHVITAKGSF
jgi:hypothetical protein